MHIIDYISHWKSLQLSNKHVQKSTRVIIGIDRHTFDFPSKTPPKSSTKKLKAHSNNNNSRHEKWMFHRVYYFHCRSTVSWLVTVVVDFAILIERTRRIENAKEFWVFAPRPSPKIIFVVGPLDDKGLLFRGQCVVDVTGAFESSQMNPCKHRFYEEMRRCESEKKGNRRDYC